VDKQLAAYIKERDVILHSLDVEAYAAFRRKHGLTETPLTDPSVPLAAMHKSRLHIGYFSEEEKAVSRLWLRKNGYTTNVMGVPPHG
jgi:hypothetical protein